MNYYNYVVFVMVILFPPWPLSDYRLYSFPSTSSDSSRRSSRDKSSNSSGNNLKTATMSTTFFTATFSTCSSNHQDVGLTSCNRPSPPWNLRCQIDHNILISIVVDGEEVRAYNLNKNTRLLPKRLKRIPTLLLLCRKKNTRNESLEQNYHITTGRQLYSHTIQIENQIVTLTITRTHKVIK